MKVKVKPAPKTAGKRSVKARQKRLVKRAAYILRGVCKSRNWDTEDSTPRDSWLLVYGRRIVTLSARDIDMDGADMALVGERLGK